MKFKKTCIIFLSAFFFLLMNAIQLKAQGLPCGDPDVDCPIDGPVIILVIAILLLSVKKITESGRGATQQ